MYLNAALSTNRDLCKELAAGFARGGFQGIRQGSVIAEYVGEAKSFKQARWIRHNHPESARWFIKMEGMSRSLNGCPVDLAKMARQHGLASTANHAATEEEANARICVRTDLVSPVTGLSPVIHLVATKFIPASQPGKDGGPAVYVNIRWAYPEKALKFDHIPPPSDSTDEEEEEEEEEEEVEEEDQTAGSEDEGEENLDVDEAGGGGGGQHHLHARACVHTHTHIHVHVH